VDHPPTECVCGSTVIWLSRRQGAKWRSFRYFTPLDDYIKSLTSEYRGLLTEKYDKTVVADQQAANA
jgi:hypothetical protein